MFRHAKSRVAALDLASAPIPQRRVSDAGGVYSLRVGLSGGRDHAIASTTIAVHERGNDLLWSSPAAA